MSYVAVNPAYYKTQQPDGMWQEGARGWSRAPVPNWGDSPISNFPPRLAVGAAEPFFRAAAVPFASVVRVPVAPWGRQAVGPAYAQPREGYCSACVGAGTPQPMGESGCPKCTIPGIGDQCLPCEPHTKDEPECEGCLGPVRVLLTEAATADKPLTPPAPQVKPPVVTTAPPVPAPPPPAPAKRLGLIIGGGLAAGIVAALIYRAVKK